MIVVENIQVILNRMMVEIWSRGHCGEASERNKECVIRNWRKGDSRLKWQRTWLNCVRVLCFVLPSTCLVGLLASSLHLSLILHTAAGVTFPN